MGMLISLNTAFPLDKGNADAENEMMVRFVKGSGESVMFWIPTRSPLGKTVGERSALVL